jgi:hypothetical protein
VKSFWAARQEGDLQALMGAYASHVDYYSSGVLDQDAILKDQKNYLNYYTGRRYEVGAIDIIKGDDKGGPDTVRVRFSFRYRLSGKKEASGTSSQIWLLGKTNNRLQILDCKENIIRD